MIALLLSGLESVFRWLLEASWQASVLVALVLLVQMALRGRLNPRWHHALWLLVVARLLLPTLPASALSLFQFAPPPPVMVTQAVTEPFFAPAPEAGKVADTVTVSPPAYPYSAFTALTLLWLAGACALLLITWQVNRRFARHVAAARSIDDPRLLQLATAARSELGLRRSLRMIESAEVQSPAVMGLFRPTLILPVGVRTQFTDDELRFIFLHEFAHLKRGDLILQWLVALLQILHWFNPVLWYAFRRLRADREPATDALVLSRTGEAHKESYGQVLLKLLEHYHARHSLPTLVGILGDKDQFKRRFTLIARFTSGAYGWSLLGVTLIALLSILCLTKSKATESPETTQLPAPQNQPISLAQESAATTAETAGKKPAVKFTIHLVEIDQKDYAQQATAMDEAVQAGNLSFFKDRITRSTALFLMVGQNAWYSEGEVRSYVGPVKQGNDGKTVLQQKAVFIGLNADFQWRGKAHIDTKWSVGVPIGVEKLALSPDLAKSFPNGFRIPRVTITSFTDKNWDMAPGKAHGFWVGETRGWLEVGDGPLDDRIKREKPSRLAVFLTAQPASNFDKVISAQPTQTLTNLMSNAATPTPLTIRTFLVPVGFFKAPLVDNADVKPDLISRGIAFPAGATAVCLASGKIVVRNTPEQLDKLADLMRKAADATPGRIEIGLKAIEIPDDLYLANKAKVDAAVEKGDIVFFIHMEGVDFVSSPTVTTKPGLKATIEIVREFPYPTTFAPAKLVLSAAGVLSVPPMPHEFVTKDVGLSAEITPTINAADSPEPGKILLNGKFTVTDFEGFTQSNMNVKMPAFDTRESLFLDALGDNEEKGIWIPGVAANKRLLLFVSAKRCQ